ncbi:uncharacterized protein LOC127138165 [Lathyrus oleraceus]|uniref:uncharacterized protein LOC127138165 n=1 Tax=Pisum sativum TaxID=3888 RepID=UPI0021D39093|nr:uncharacterized protein LOC127138165 [Pisum sativum]
MVHLDVFFKHVMSLDVKDVVVKEVDIGNQFKNEQEIALHDHMLQQIRTKAFKLEFGVVIGRSDNGSDRRGTFATMTCEISGKHRPPLRNFKRDDTSSRKCECPFKLCGYMLANQKWRFNVMCGLHSHDLCEKLVGHPIPCRLMPKEKECD